MKIRHFIAACVMGAVLSACYFPINGRVIDAETGDPIEGAVVLVEWTKKQGIGDHQTVPIKVIEVVTNHDGEFRLEGKRRLLANLPNITIYKKNYVAWNSQYTFPEWEPNDFKWANNSRINLHPFKDKRLRANHVLFLQTFTHWGKAISEAYRWEEMARDGQ